LLSLLDEADENDDEWSLEELPVVLGMIGPAAITALEARLYDPSLTLWTRVAAAGALKEIAQRHPASRSDVVASLAQLLGRFAENGTDLNAFLVSYLLDLKAIEEAQLMERAFAAGAVDIDIPGDWEDAQVELGLLEERVTPSPAYGLLSVQSRHEPPEASMVGHHAHHSKSRRKARRKMAKDSRRRNRRKK
jgi:hypothetical protein